MEVEGDSTKNPNIESTGVREPLIVFQDNGVDDVWNRTDRLNISYCVPSYAFGKQRSRVVTMINRAASAWEKAANVRFVHLTGQDSDCTEYNENVKYNVVEGCTNADGSACDGNMSDPGAPRRNRQLQILAPAGWGDDYFLNLLIHELGHGLGFAHEHTRIEGSNCEENDPYRELTPYDNKSVMHYDNCPYFDSSNAYVGLSQWDFEGAQAVYEAPTNVLNTSDGTIYARKMSNGDIYRRDGSSWTKIGGPGQAFVTVGNTLYGQTPGRGRPVVYSPDGNWYYIGGAAGQIFNCGGALCATDPNSGNIAEYDGSRWWTIIGGPGARFAANNTTAYSTLFGIGPRHEYVARYNSSVTSWTIVSTGTEGGSELIGGEFMMLRLTNLRDAIQRYDGGTTWNTIGGPGRQFIVSSGLYGLSPDGNAIYKYATTHWNWVHGAATRMYGTYGRLFVTLANGDIEQYDESSNTWNNIGQP